jgi:signal transduction histidine kinase
VRWWRRRTLRARLTLLSAAGVAVGLGIGGLLIISVVHFVLIRSVDSTTRQSAKDVSALVVSDKLPLRIPSAGTSIIQVLDDKKRVVGATLNADPLVPILTPAEQARAIDGNVVIIPGNRVGEDGELRVIARTAFVRDVDHDGDGGGRIIIVGAPTHAVAESSETVGWLLLIAYPLLVAFLSAAAWLVVGWTLRPVEALRRSADQISAGGGSVGPLPVPDGDDEVHRLAVTLNDMLDRLEVGRARQRAFVADAAHELRSPITSLRTQLEVADHLHEPPVTSDLLDDVGRLGRLVDDLLLLARADEGDPKLRTAEPTDLLRIAESAADGFIGARVPVTAQVNEPVWTVGDPTSLRRVLDNLITNAVRHATSAVVISASGPHPGGTVRLTVIDDGPGMPTQDRERVFDRFTRGDNARDRDQGGAGLGLAIVRELLRMHQGTITLTDAGPGLRVDVDLPAAEATAAPSLTP